MKFQFEFVFSIERTEHRGRYMCTIEIIDREFVGCNCRITERKMVFFAFCISKLSTFVPNMFSRSEASTLQRTELNYVLPSSRLPQYKRLAALSHQRETRVVILLPMIVLWNKLIMTIPKTNKFSFMYVLYVSTVLDCLLQRLTADFRKKCGN